MPYGRRLCRSSFEQSLVKVGSFFSKIAILATNQQLLTLALNRHSQGELEVVDAEGRCVVTDHGAFVLFNLYGPAITSEESAKERFAYKLQFYQV